MPPIRACNELGELIVNITSFDFSGKKRETSKEYKDKDNQENKK